MPDELSRVFEVVCKGCGRSLMTVDRIRDAHVAVLIDHLRACSPSEPFGEAPPLGAIMARVRVAAVERA